MHGARQNVDVNTSPSGARIETSPVTGNFTTPTTLNLERKNNYVLTFTSPGYAPATMNITNSVGVGTLIADVLLTGLIGVIVDATTGSWYGLNPESATVTLNRLTGSGPETIHVQVGAANRSGGMKLDADVPGISVEVTRK
jgi:hypothetical protein